MPKEHLPIKGSRFPLREYPPPFVPLPWRHEVCVQRTNRCKRLKYKGERSLSLLMAVAFASAKTRRGRRQRRVEHAIPPIGESRSCCAFIFWTSRVTLIGVSRRFLMVQWVV